MVGDRHAISAVRATSSLACNGIFISAITASAPAVGDLWKWAGWYQE